jgi:hypothetical protein
MEWIQLAHDLESRALENIVMNLPVPYKVVNFFTSCGLVGRVSGYRSRGPRFDSRRFQIF